MKNCLSLFAALVAAIAFVIITMPPAGNVPVNAVEVVHKELGVVLTVFGLAFIAIRLILAFTDKTSSQEEEKQKPTHAKWIRLQGRGRTATIWALKAGGVYNLKFLQFDPTDDSILVEVMKQGSNKPTLVWLTMLQGAFILPSANPGEVRDRSTAATGTLNDIHEVCVRHESDQRRLVPSAKTSTALTPWMDGPTEEQKALFHAKLPASAKQSAVPVEDHPPTGEFVAAL